MPRYFVERTFSDGFKLQANTEGALACIDIAGRNSERGVTWIHSYVTVGKRLTFCVWDAPTPEAIRAASQKNGLPVDRITEVRILDPYFHF